MKKPDIKSLLVNHVEKMVFGLFALIVLIVLAKTTWGRYAKSPDDLIQDINKVEDAIKSPKNVWADEKSYKVVDYSEKARKMFTPISVGYYEFSTPLFFALYRKDEPRREPNYEPIQELIVKSSLVSLSMQKESDPTTKTDAPQVAAVESEPAIDDEFGNRNAVKPGSAPATPAIAAGGGTLGLSFGKGFGGGNKRKQERDRDNDSFMGSGIVGAAPTPKSTNITSRGVRVIAVRGIFPLEKQIENFRKSLHVSHQEALNLVEITDFILERQVALQGDDPWKNSTWEVVDIESALDVLNECSDVDPLDPVPLAMKDAVITMNLPLRLLGFWQENATHPRIKDLELKGDEIEKENNMLEAADEAAEEANVTDAPKRRRRGLSLAQADMKQFIAKVKNNAAASEVMKQKFGRNVGGGARGGEDVDRLIAEKKYLLFRYFDFDVKSGYAYRYRVRLKLRNPNFDAPIDQIAGADPEIAKGEERDTVWSNVSNAEVVDTTVNYFLKDVERDPYREEKVKSNTSKPVARLAMYDWDKNLGTVVYDVMNMMAIGGFVGDSKDARDAAKKETPVFDPVTSIITKKKDHKFTARDVLLDVEPDAEVVLDQHPDLKIPVEKKSSSIRVGLLEEALFATELGDLKTIDPITEHSDEERWNRRMLSERKFAQEAVVKDDTEKKPSATRKRMGRRRGRRGGR